MARLAIFCLPSELEAWLQALSEAHDLSALVFRRDRDGELVLDPAGATLLDGPVRRLFLMPAAQRPPDGISMNDVRSRDGGYLDVEPGGLVEHDGDRILCYSEVVGEDFAHEPVHPARFVRWLKRRVKKVARAGVIGWNPVTGGSSRYRDLWHTEAARALLADGVQWKQSVQNRARFKPGED